MKKATKTVYECEFCGKLSYNAGAMHNHEARCKKNPVNIPRCWGCEHLVWEPEPIEVPYERFCYGLVSEGVMKVENRRCAKTGCVMYSILTSERKLADLQAEGFVRMPSLAEGCPDFKDVPKIVTELWP